MSKRYGLEQANDPNDLSNIQRGRKIFPLIFFGLFKTQLFKLLITLLREYVKSSVPTVMNYENGYWKFCALKFNDN